MTRTRQRHPRGVQLAVARPSGSASRAAVVACSRRMALRGARPCATRTASRRPGPGRSPARRFLPPPPAYLASGHERRRPCHPDGRTAPTTAVRPRRPSHAQPAPHFVARAADSLPDYLRGRAPLPPGCWPRRDVPKRTTAMPPVAGLPAGALRPRDRRRARVLLAHTPNGIFAIDDRCPHAAAPLSIGELDGCIVAAPSTTAGSVWRRRPAQMPTTGGLGQQCLHRTWSRPRGRPSEPPGKKPEARRLTRVPPLLHPVRTAGASRGRAPRLGPPTAAPSVPASGPREPVWLAAPFLGLRHVSLH